MCKSSWRYLNLINREQKKKFSNVLYRYTHQQHEIIYRYLFIVHGKYIIYFIEIQSGVSCFINARYLLGKSKLDRHVDTLPTNGNMNVCKFLFNVRCAVTYGTCTNIGKWAETNYAVGNAKHARYLLHAHLV